MYHFALVALMALAVVKVVDVLTDNVEALQRFRSLLTIAFGVGIVLWLDYSIFDGWDIAIDDRDTGLWLTGFMVAGMTVPWRAVFGYLTHDRAAVGRDPRAALPRDQARRLAHAGILRWAPEHAPGPIVASQAQARPRSSSSTAAPASGTWYGQKCPAPSIGANPAPRASATSRAFASSPKGSSVAWSTRPAPRVGAHGPQCGAGWAVAERYRSRMQLPMSASDAAAISRAPSWGTPSPSRPAARSSTRHARSAPRRRPLRRPASARAGRTGATRSRGGRRWRRRRPTSATGRRGRWRPGA